MAIARATGNAWLNTSNASSVSVSRAFANSVTAGSLLVAVTSYPANQVPTVSDNNGNTWTSALIGQYDGSLVQNIYLSYALNANAGATTVTASGGGNMNRFLGICEYTGAATSSAVDGTPVATSGTSSNPDPGAITTTTAGVLIGAAVVYPTTGPTAGTNYTRQITVTPSGLYHVVVEDWITTGAQTDNHPSWATSESYWCALGAAFKEAAGGASAAALALPYHARNMANLISL